MFATLRQANHNGAITTLFSSRSKCLHFGNFDFSLLDYAVSHGQLLMKIDQLVCCHYSFEHLSCKHLLC